MIENETSEQEMRLPAQQVQQPQPAAASGQTDLALRAPIDAAGKKRDGDGGADGAAGPTVDDARFAAGVVKLYEALLQEPIPEEMLRLVEKLSKQERK
jgi:hypothetical protein